MRDAMLQAERLSRGVAAENLRLAAVAVLEPASVSESARASLLPVVANLTPFLLWLLLLLFDAALILKLLLVLIVLLFLVLILLPPLLVATVTRRAALRSPIVRFAGQKFWGEIEGIRTKSRVPEHHI